jgi:hypothetical protein
MGTFYAGQEERVLDCAPFHQIHLSPEQAFQFLGQAEVLVQCGKPAVSLERDQKIDVATIWIEVGPASGGAKHLQLPYPITEAQQGYLGSAPVNQWVHDGPREP